MKDYAALRPSASPGEVSAPAVWGALSALLIAFGVETDKALAIAGACAAVAPYIVKAVIWFRGRADG